MGAVIRTEGLGKTYRRGGTALRSLDLELSGGEAFGFLGPNGAGKSTAIHLLLDFIRPSEGAAFLSGEPASRSRARRRVGHVPETVRLPGYYTGWGLLEFQAGLAGLGRPERARRASRMLETVCLAHAAGRRLSGYSKGVLQRLALSQALIAEPDLLILDEPTFNLDPQVRKHVRDLLLEAKGRGATVFISSHILSEVEAVCDRVGILAKEVLRRVGTPTDLSAGGGSEIVVPELPATAIEALSMTGAQVVLNGRKATIACDGPDQEAEVRRVLEERGAAVDAVHARPQSLEEIFRREVGPEAGP
ncbi:MAG: ABC transporter ATP-binding protein [Bryobacterales bacterium]|nr:ABC transporter ATP-binding protein [Bryobacterales bacterium]